MPWTTPSLKEVRRQVRDDIAAGLGAASLVPNSVVRILADADAGLAHLVLLYIDWLSRQLLPDTSETEWLGRHGEIWLRNADGSKGRKAATFAAGTVELTGLPGTVVPQATPLVSVAGITYETAADVTIGEEPTNVAVNATSAGAAGNLDAGETLRMTVAVSGADGSATVVSLTGGADDESDDYLRERVLFRIQEPPMGGAEADYVRWVKAVPGVTRAWAAPQEMGVGTMTVRFMMDELRAGANGFPDGEDVDAVAAYLDSVRPVTVKDMFVVAPIPQAISFTISDLQTDDAATRAEILASVKAMFLKRAKPGQTMYRSWVSEAVSQAVGEESHELTFVSTPMTTAGHIPVLGTITYT